VICWYQLRQPRHELFGFAIYDSGKCHKPTNAGVSIDLQTRGLTMTATMEPTTMEPATVKSAAVEPAVFAAVESVTIMIMESAEALVAESVISAIAVAVRGKVAVASVIPPSIGTSRQAEGRNQKRDKDNQFYFHYLMRRQAGRMTSGAEDVRCVAGLATAGPVFRTPASVPTSNLSTEQPLDNAIFSTRSRFQMILLPDKNPKGWLLPPTLTDEIHHRPIQARCREFQLTDSTLKRPLDWWHS
jgi:hypothetical protein